MWDMTDTEVKTLCTLTISTHTSRVRCADDSFKVATPDDAFLLTHPVWDVTIFIFPLLDTFQISTHTSRVGCDNFITWFMDACVISTHTSRVGCDTIY